MQVVIWRHYVNARIIPASTMYTLTRAFCNRSALHAIVLDALVLRKMPEHYHIQTSTRSHVPASCCLSCHQHRPSRNSDGIVCTLRHRRSSWPSADRYMGVKLSQTRCIYVILTHLPSGNAHIPGHKTPDHSKYLVQAVLNSDSDNL